MGLCTVDIVRIIKILKTREINSLLMIGRQNINTTWEIFVPIMETFGWKYDKTLFNQINGSNPIDTYKFFKMFGVKEVHAIDYNEFDGADILLDLNADLPEELKGKYDMVLNGGTLEHVFDVAKAMKNISDIVKVGGIVVHILPAAGYVEHGFYSFSPTFFTDFYKKNNWNIIDLDLEFRMTKNIPQPEWSLVYSQDCRLFQAYRNDGEWISAQEKLNDYINKIFNVDSMENILIWCIAQRNTVEDFVYPIQGVYDSINVKTEKTVKAVDYEKALKIICENSGKRIVLYGAGDICNRLINCLYQYDMENSVEFIFDSNIEKSGTQIRGYRVVYPTKKKLDDSDIILVCTNKYEDEVVADLKTRGVVEQKIKKITKGD